MQITPNNCSKTRNILGLLACIVVMLSVSALLGMQTRANIPDWYDYLVKPAFQPPALAFPLVWTVLYIGLGIVMWRVFNGQNKPAKFWFASNIVMNWAWTPVFFGLRALLPAAILLVLIWGSGLQLLRSLHGSDKLSFIICLPYQLWLSFAAYLSWGVWWLN